MPIRTLSFRWISDDLVVVHGARALYADRDWNAFVTSFAPRRPAASGFRVLVYDAKAGPNPAQHARFSRATKGATLREAVVTPSAIARAAVNALRLCGMPMTALPPKREAEAFRYLGLSDDEARLAQESLEQMRSEGAERTAPPPSRASIRPARASVRPGSARGIRPAPTSIRSSRPAPPPAKASLRPAAPPARASLRPASPSADDNVRTGLPNAALTTAEEGPRPPSMRSRFTRPSARGVVPPRPGQKRPPPARRARGRRECDLSTPAPGRATAPPARHRSAARSLA
jgi:hypothetical protein